MKRIGIFAKNGEPGRNVTSSDAHKRLGNYRIAPNRSCLPFSNFAVAGSIEPAPI